MRGTILGVHDGRGVLIAADDRRIDFPLSEWRSPGAPTAGQVVDFMDEGGHARGVFAVPGLSAGQSHSSSFILGAVALGCLALGFIIPLIPTIAAFVLGVIGANQAQAQRDDTALTMSRVAWIGSLVMLIVGLLAVMAVIAFVGTIGFASLFQLGPGDF